MKSDDKKYQEEARSTMSRLYDFFYGKDPYVPDPTFPTKLKIGGRTYDILHFLKVGDVFIIGDVLNERAKELKAEGDHKHVRFILDNQRYIPRKFRPISFIFPNRVNMWGAPDHEYLEKVYWCKRENQWKEVIDWVNYHGWKNDGHRLVRLRTGSKKIGKEG